MHTRMTVNYKLLDISTMISPFLFINDVKLIFEVFGPGYNIKQVFLYAVFELTVCESLSISGLGLDIL